MLSTCLNQWMLHAATHPVIWFYSSWSLAIIINSTCALINLSIHSIEIVNLISSCTAIGIWTESSKDHVSYVIKISGLTSKQNLSCIVLFNTSTSYASETLKMWSLVDFSKKAGIPLTMYIFEDALNLPMNLEYNIWETH